MPGIMYDEDGMYRDYPDEWSDAAEADWGGDYYAEAEARDLREFDDHGDPLAAAEIEDHLTVYPWWRRTGLYDEDGILVRPFKDAAAWLRAAKDTAA